MATPLKLYYDVVSPYAWIGFEVLCRYKNKWNVALELQPFYLAGIMGGSGNRPPGVVPAKARYNGRDLLRLNQFYQIPLNLPTDFAHVMFEKGSLFPQRFLTAIKQDCPDNLEAVSRQLWLRIWSRDEDIASPDSVREAAKCAGLSNELIDKLITRATDQEIKDRLKEVTQEALDLGAFGAPFIVTEVNGKKKAFFGSDRFELIAYIIGEKWEGPLLQHKAKY